MKGCVKGSRGLGGWLSRGVETPCGGNEEPQSGSLGKVMAQTRDAAYLSLHLGWAGAFPS